MGSTLLKTPSTFVSLKSCRFLDFIFLVLCNDVPTLPYITYIYYFRVPLKRTNKGLTGDAPRDRVGEVVVDLMVQDVVVAEVGVVEAEVGVATETNELVVVGEEEEEGEE